MQLARVGSITKVETEVSISRRGKGFEVTTKRGKRYLSKTVILATGICDEHPNISNLENLRELDLLKYCSICDGYELREKPVAVLAKDDAGLQKALFISHWTRNLKILIPRNFQLSSQREKEIQVRGIDVVHYDRLKILPKNGRGRGVAILINGKKEFFCQAAHIELGCKVNDSAFRKLRSLKRTQAGFIITTTEQRTSVPGLFAIGDCVNLLGQVNVAAGQAAVAATTVHNDLMESKWS